MPSSGAAIIPFLAMGVAERFGARVMVRHCFLPPKEAGREAVGLVFAHARSSVEVWHGQGWS